MPRKRWIDKSTATTYHLLHRPQDDPRLHDPAAPEQVLHPKPAPPSERTKARNLARLEAELFGGDADYAASSSSLRASDGYAGGDDGADFLYDDDEAVDAAGGEGGARKAAAGSAARGGAWRGVRANEGEAAEHGVFFDDSAYDYMQHLRAVDDDDAEAAPSGQSTWIEAPAIQSKAKGKTRGKEKVPLDEALREMDLDAPSPPRSVATHSGSVAYAGSAAYAGSMATGASRATTDTRPRWAAQQDVPDELRGLAPDLDPRLREVLEALDDEAYLDHGDAAAQPKLKKGEASEQAGAEEVDGEGDAEVAGDDFFAAIAAGGEEVSAEEFAALGELFEDTDGGWGSDDTARPASVRPRRGSAEQDARTERIATEPTSGSEAPIEAAPPPDHGDGAFMAAFHDPAQRPRRPATDTPLPFRPAAGPSTSHSATTAAPPAGSVASLLTSAPSAALLAAADAGAFRPGRRRKGAQTRSAAFSMTSASVPRSEALETLDARFEKVLREYDEDDDAADDADCSESAAGDGHSLLSGASGLSAASGVSGASRGRHASKAPSVISRASVASRASAASAASSLAALDGAMDEFLADTGGRAGGRKRTWGAGAAGLKAARKERGLRELDAIRAELGPARVR